ncbi:hypothetical protein [Pseudomonas sp. S2_A05]
MSKGAKPGQNRFAGSQKRNLDYRIGRIKEEVIPKLKAYAGKATFEGITPFSRFCAELYNEGLPVNEKKIGYRTFVQSSDYWALIGPLYYRYWDFKDSMGPRKDKLVGKLAAQRANDLQSEVERLQNEVEALRAALRLHGAAPKPIPNEQDRDQSNLTKFDKTCRALKLVLDASDGMFSVDMQTKKITCAYNDLEPEEGLAPKELTEPFVAWLKSKEKNHGQQ